MENMNKRWWDIWATLLLLFTLWITALRLELTGWTNYLNRVELLVTIGVVLGLMLGVSTFDKRVVRWMAAAYSMFFIPWQLATTIQNEPSWSLRLLNVWERSLDSLNLFLRNQPAADTTLFLLIMSTLFWFLGLTSGYMLTRYAKPWVPLILTGLTLFVIDFNDPGRASQNRFTGLFVLFSLLLLGRLYYLRSQHAWNEKGVAVEFETGFTISRSMIVGGLLLVFAAWNTPVVLAAFSYGTPANQAFTERWNRIRERTSNAFAGLESSVVYVYDFYQDSMSLGTGTGLGEQLFFTVEPSYLPERFRFYWRGYSYDFYDGLEWSNTIEGRGNINPDAWPLAYAQYEARRQVDLEFKMANVGMRPVYSPPMLLSFDQPARYVVDDIGDGFVDLVGVVAEPSIRPGAAFTTRSWVAVPTVNQLRAAGTEYPEWTQRYLQLPDDFPDSIRLLAEQITAGDDNPYHQADSITQYLRSEITYQETIEEPPADRDVMEWFLFDYKTGFCNYYATAEILMLRSLGIPARIAVGFAQGDYDEEENKFVVREKESHAWPEVFFPGIGWVEFEPTVSQPMQEWIELSDEEGQDNSSPVSPAFPDNRPLMDFEGMDGRFDDMDNSPAGGEASLPSGPVNFTWVWVFSLLAILTTVAWLFSRRYPEWLAEPLPIKLERSFKKIGIDTPRIIWYWARQMELHPIERMFNQVTWMLKLLGYAVEAGTTPQEQVETLISHIPDAQEPGSILLTQFQLAVYSPHPFDLAHARQANLRLWRLVTVKSTKRVVKWLPV
jgi:transglutaminase-like putative cysteine protease